MAAYVAAKGGARGVQPTPPRSGEKGWAGAAGLVRQTHDKEDRALASLAPLDPGKRAAGLVSAARRQLGASREAELRALEETYAAMTGKRPTRSGFPGTRRPWREASTPANHVARTSRTRDTVEGPAGLHPLMALKR